MAHLNYQGIENFRLFKGLNNFDFAPISIFTGVNNSGKSSVLKSILLFRESVLKSRKLEKLLFSESSQRLGTFSDCFNDSLLGEKAISYTYKLPIPQFDDEIKIKFEFIPEESFPENGILKSFSILKNGESILHFANIVKVQETPFYNKKVAFDLDGSIRKSLTIDLPYFIDKCVKMIIARKEGAAGRAELSQSIQEAILDGALSEDSQLEAMMGYASSIEHGNSVFNSFYSQKSIIQVDPDCEKIDTSQPLFFLRNGLTDEIIDDEKFQEKIEARINTIANNTTFVSYDNHDVSGFPQSPLEWFLEYDITSFIISQREIEGRNEIILSEFGDYLFNTFIKDFISNSFKYVLNFFAGVNSLTSIRANTERLYRNSSDIVDINSLIINFIESNINGDPRIKKFINQSLQLFNIGDGISVERHQGTASEIFIHKGDAKRLLADLGFGYSQLIPIIMKIALIAKRNLIEEDSNIYKFLPSVLILEEPESNLHPSYQSKLMDLIINAAKTFNIQFFIETHSEYLIRKLQYFIAKKELTPNDVKLYYFHDQEDSAEKKKQFERIEIRPDGILKQDFGEGFYDESIRLTMDLLKIQNVN
ncbi:AAA family ATPase [Mangrovibacterium diazotrophicum]|uniref:Uncharacterized protein DUF3696 n=1 Tax=Mangrovibacterium diazotrophicum TaxID=1261403 RepID=A0A419W3G6_9BACT|nr:DUF3696 domain-containing protein [Mangrovibacterium diazotrophicum]RKD90017.1 uncharacterized protein DUF3696 [Mangrovibacterium diazotrophicum]